MADTSVLIVAIKGAGLVVAVPVVVEVTRPPGLVALARVLARATCLVWLGVRRSRVTG